MTEAWWLRCADPQEMFSYHLFRHPSSNRKMRLFAVACCRRVWGLLADERLRRAVEVAELFADRLTSERQLMATELDLESFSGSTNAYHVAYYTIRGDPVNAFRYTAELPNEVAFLNAIASGTTHLSPAVLAVTKQAELSAQAALLRDIVGNPFRTVDIDPTWLTWKNGTVPKLAQTIYDERRFEELPILTDALEEAGCADYVILEHCRQSGVHVRGCWVVDLLLGKE